MRMTERGTRQSPNRFGRPNRSTPSTSPDQRAAYRKALTSPMPTYRQMKL